VVIVVVVVAAVLILAVVLVVPFLTNVHHSWSTTFEAKPGVPVSVTPPTFPGGTTVNGNWSAVGSGWVNFSIKNAGFLVYNQNGTQGTFVLLSDGLAYMIDALSNAYENITVKLTYTAPGAFL
jgi:hypothetical protein